MYEIVKYGSVGLCVVILVMVFVKEIMNKKKKTNEK